MYFAKIFKPIRAIAIVESDRLLPKSRKRHFRDALGAPISKQQLSVCQLQLAIFAHMPTWVNALMGLRNKIVQYLGFQVGQEGLAPSKAELNIGDKAGFLTVLEKYQDEIISYAEDRHMQFYLSVSKKQQQVIVSTLVNPKTFVGRIYLQCILPFHYVIARMVLINAIKNKRI